MEEQLENFEEVNGVFYREGTAKSRGMRNLCKKKLCVFSTEKEFLFDMLHELSKANDCFEVKVFKTERLGIHCGHCLFTNESSLGDAWARYESHPSIWAVIHDDEFSSTYKDKIRSYNS
jgi:hypothetical protein